MTLLVVHLMEFSSKSFAAQRTSMIGFRAFCRRRVEDLGEIALVRVVGSGVILEVFRICEALVSETIRDIALIRSIVNVDVPA
jgi:hypothetical protein